MTINREKLDSGEVNPDSSLGERVEDSSLSADLDLDTSAVEFDRDVHPETSPDVKGDAGSAMFLIGLTKWHPFIGLFLFLTDCNFPQSMAPHERVRGMRAEHPKWYCVAVVMDFVWLFATLVFLGWIAIRIVGSAIA